VESLLWQYQSSKFISKIFLVIKNMIRSNANWNIAFRSTGDFD